MLYKNILTRNKNMARLKNDTYLSCEGIWLYWCFLSQSRSLRPQNITVMDTFRSSFPVYCVLWRWDGVELYTVMIVHFYRKCKSVLWNDFFTHFPWNCDIVPNTLQWRHNGHDGVSNHRRLDCLFNRFSSADQRKHQSSASLGFVRETTGDRWIPLTKGK